MATKTELAQQLTHALAQLGEAQARIADLEHELSELRKEPEAPHSVPAGRPYKLRTYDDGKFFKVVVPSFNREKVKEALAAFKADFPQYQNSTIAVEFE